MSDSADLELKEQVSRIGRIMAESDKFREATFRLLREARKLVEETQRLRRDRGLAP